MQAWTGFWHPVLKSVVRNAPELGVEFLKEQVKENAPQLVFKERISNPAAFPIIDADRALKVLVYELSSDGVSDH